VRHRVPSHFNWSLLTDRTTGSLHGRDFLEKQTVLWLRVKFSHVIEPVSILPPATNLQILNGMDLHTEGRGSTVVKVLCYKSEGRWFDPGWCQWIFH